MKMLLGTKKKMTQLFAADGEVVPVTVVEAEPAVVSAVTERTVALAFGKAKHLKKPQAGFFKDLGRFRWVREFPVGDGETRPERGAKIDVSVFSPGERVRVSGISKGKGFQGVVKRHGFSGGPKTHGQKHGHRAPGSIGATTPQKVLKGMRMAGRMGFKRITVKNLEVIKVDPEQHLLYLRGAVPGSRGTLLEIHA
ncbi:50S ribosomal protein L3 [Candidatus Parcubacteria bacterium]|nr:50S ribosomal protein L3 [Candidatus Parcubacteria bacterium]MBI4385548.1 50S ribosomal protein L3 [Candidatus Parcubacteria bacterium]